MKIISLILILLINTISCMESQKTKYPPEEYFQGKELTMAKAIYYENQSEIENLVIHKGYDINIRGKGKTRGIICNYTYLSYAILLNDVNSAKKLLELGAEVNKISLWGGAGVANINSACVEKNKQMINLLLQYKVNLNPPLDKSPIDPLLVGKVDKSLIELLVNNGANLNHPNYIDGGTPIMTALSLGKFDYVNYFLDKGADPLLPDSSGNSFASLIQEEIDEGRLSDSGLREYNKLKKRLINEFHIPYPLKINRKKEWQKGTIMTIARYENLSKEDKNLLGEQEVKRIAKWKKELDESIEEESKK